jgi:hypothetical protein
MDRISARQFNGWGGMQRIYAPQLRGREGTGTGLPGGHESAAAGPGLRYRDSGVGVRRRVREMD